MNKLKNRAAGLAGISGLTFVCFTLISSCSENMPTQTGNVSKPSEYQSEGEKSSVANRAGGSTESAAINQIFGNGYLTNSNSASTTNGVNANLTGVIGNVGGFGPNGSIASIIGNIGGFGFGGFGAFASFVTGTLPTTPPDGVLLPPGATPPPAFGFVPPLGGAIPPVSGATPPAGGFIPPVGGFVPPTGGFAPPAGFTPPAGGFTPPAGLGARFNIPAIADANLSELKTPLANVDLDFLFVSPGSLNPPGSPNSGASTTNKLNYAILALTETVTDCAGGGTRTRIVDDVDPVGLSTGDTRTTVFADCARSVGGSTLNGSRGFTNDEVIGTPFIDLTWSTQSTLFHDNLTTTNLTAGTSDVSNGSTSTGVSVTDNNLISQVASGTGTRVRTDANGERTANHTFNMAFNWDVAAQTYTISFDINVESISVGQASAIIDTVTPFAGAIGQPPSSGQIQVTRIVDSVTASITTATAQTDGTVLVETDTDADGVIDTSTTVPGWSDVLFSLFNF